KNRYLDRLSIHFLLSRENPGSDLFSGRITGEKCRSFCRHLIDLSEVDDVFICGPQPMLIDLRDTLKEMGFNAKDIHYELFTTQLGEKQAGTKPAKKVKSREGKVQVTITLDGETTHFSMESSEQTILDAALEAGSDLPFACKGGVCSTCRAKLMAGEVDMEVNYALEEEELEQGYILTCQAHPLTDEVKVDFDA
ncbi:MAG: 2Fe-2S iron-sulfur cluster-binding protein, partial [Saprospiraceae bacterium]|nr:2Fe-2S iron-sulfur cluster-binding protein [Saprospiraceae bacterium]